VIFCILKVTEDNGTDLHPDPVPVVRGTDPRIQIHIRIRTKMSRIRSTATHYESWICIQLADPDPQRRTQ
jgi:hypothetical protein